MPDDRTLPDLPRWLREVELERGGERQEAIVAGALALANETRGLPLLDVVLLAHGKSQGEAYASLSAAVRSADATFSAGGTDLEAHLAAGAAVAAMLQSSDTASLAAHAVLSAQWLDLTPAVPDLPSLATGALAHRSELVRRRGPIAPASPTEAAFSEVPEFADDGQPVYSQDARAIAAGAKTASAWNSKAIEDVSSELLFRLDATDEELNVLWWAFSGFSERAGRKWVELNAPAAGLLVGIELAELLRFDTEPPSTEALLMRLLGKAATTEVSIAEAVEAGAVSLEGREAVEGHQLLPLLSSLSENRALSGKPAWRDSISRWSLNATLTTSASDLARQAVREILSVASL